MEEALQRLMKESGSTKYANVASAANKALGASTASTMRMKTDKPLQVLLLLFKAKGHCNAIMG